MKIIFFLHISSSYAKILGETNFQSQELPRSGWKVEGGEERKRKKKKKKEEEKSRWKQWAASLRPPPRVAHASTPGPKSLFFQIHCLGWGLWSFGNVPKFYIFKNRNNAGLLFNPHSAGLWELQGDGRNQIIYACI